MSRLAFLAAASQPFGPPKLSLSTRNTVKNRSRLPSSARFASHPLSLSNSQTRLSEPVLSSQSAIEIYVLDFPSPLSPYTTNLSLRVVGACNTLFPRFPGQPH